MADFYFNNAVDTSLSTLGNYWTDSGYTVPAGDFPQATDDLTIGGAQFVDAGSIFVLHDVMSESYY